MNSNKYKILIIEDEANIRNFVSTLLESSGYQVLTAESCTMGLLMFSSHLPDLIILDLGLPDCDGSVLIDKVRAESPVPIIVLSARSEEMEKVKALDMGANDYITKPFGSEELLARIRSALRNAVRGAAAGRAPGAKFEVDGLVIDYDARRVFVNDVEVKLTQTEYNILAFLSENSGKVMTYTAIIKAIWGYPDVGSTKKLQVNMANIRKKMGLTPGEDSYIINELGVGYRMK